MSTAIDPIRVAFIDWTKKHPAHWPLHVIVVNDEFSRFGDHDTDTAWMGFEAAGKLLRPRIKPLRWTINRRAHTIVGIYFVVPSGEPDEWSWWLRSDQHGTMRQICRTEGAAMTACENHYASLLATAFEGPGL